MIWLLFACLGILYLLPLVIGTLMFFFLIRKVEEFMATLQELNDTLDAVAEGVNGLEAAIKDLKAQVAAGGVVSQADLDALFEKAKAIGSDIADTSDL